MGVTGVGVTEARVTGVRVTGREAAAPTKKAGSAFEQCTQVINPV